MSATSPEISGATVTATQVLANVDLAGKTAIVTGGTSGLGRETVRALAAAGATVLFTGRDLARARAVAAAIRGETGNASVEAAAVDLTALDQVDAVAAEMRGRFPKLDMLILNAATIVPDLQRNAQGIEVQFMAAYLAHLVVATVLAPSLIAAAPSRIVSLTSSGHKMSPVRLEDLNFRERAYDALSSYGQAKTATSLLAIALNARLAARGVLAFAVHPGVILDTGLSRHLDGSQDEKARVEEYAIPPEALKSVPAGAATIVWAATSPDAAKGGGGKYCEDCHISEPADGGGAFSGVLDYAVDPVIADQLWAGAEALLGRSLIV